MKAASARGERQMLPRQTKRKEVGSVGGTVGAILRVEVGLEMCVWSALCVVDVFRRVFRQVVFG